MEVLAASEERLLLLLLKEQRRNQQLLGPWGAINAGSYCYYCCNIKRVWLDCCEIFSKQINQVIVDVIKLSSSPLLLVVGGVAGLLNL